MTRITRFFTASIRRKILSSFAIVIVLVLGMVLVGFYQLSQVRTSAAQIGPTSLQIGALQDFGLAVSSLDANLERLFVIGGAQFEEAILQDLANMTAALESLQANAGTEAQPAVAALDQLVATLSSQITALLAAQTTDLTTRQINEQIIALYAQIELIEQAHQELSAATLGQLESTAVAQRSITANVMTQFLVVGVLVTLVVVGASAIVTRTIATPLAGLAKTATQIAAGDLEAAAPRITQQDEVGQLAVAFTSMTEQLRQMIGSLADQVSARTRQLEAVVEVSQRLVGILELSELMRQVVSLTKETFAYYHVHIYLLEGETLLMAEGYGEAGAEMKRRRHSIPLAAPQSLVARAARQGQVIIVENVREDPNWLPNPLLPETYAEMAVPIRSGAELVGVLDVQSERISGLTADDKATLQALANQIAIAVRNARAFAHSQAALEEAQRLQRLYTGQAWEQFRAARRTTDYEFHQAEVPPLGEIATPEVLAVLEQAQTVTLITNGKPVSVSNGENNRTASVEAEAEVNSALTKSRNALATPLKLRDQIIGVLGLHDENPDRRWSEEEIALIEAVSEQMSLAIENARLFEHTQRDAWRNQVISETTAKVWASSEIEAVMRAAVAELGDKLQASEVVIRLGADDEITSE